jgi:predicted MFS family arabinose efflux permease
MLFAGHLADRMDRRVLLVSIYLLRSLAFIVPLYVATDYSLLIMFSIYVGTVFYATFPPTIGLSAAHFGVSNLGLVMGMLTVGHALGAAGGAYLGGAIFDLLLRYEWPWAVSIALAASAGLFTLLIPDPRGSGHSETN